MSDTPQSDSSIDARTRAIIATIPPAARRLFGAGVCYGLLGREAVVEQYGEQLAAELEAVYQRAAINPHEGGTQ